MKRIVYAVMTAVVLCPAAAWAGYTPKGEHYALLVGVRQYSEAKELRPLPYAENDVTELAQVLRDGGYKPDNVVLMTQAAGADQLRYLPLKARILKELDLLLKSRSEDDTVMLAFAGHGVVLKGDPDSYFCPADAQLDDKDTLLSLTEVYRELEKCKAGTKVLLVDACRNDPLADKSRAVPKLDLDSVTRPPDPAKDGGVAAFFSCSRGQKAYEDDKSKHGAFFHFVIEGLKGDAAPDKDDVTLLELGAYVQRRVADFSRAEWGADQKPEMTNASAQGAAALVEATEYVKAYRRGKKLFEEREYAKAEGAFTEALRLQPDYAKAFVGRALVRSKVGDFDKAIADCDEAIRLDPRNAYAFAFRGGCWLAKEDLDKGVADLNQAIRLAPDYALAFQFRSNYWVRKRDFNKAIADADEAVRLDPKDSNALVARGQVRRLMPDPDYEKAIADYNAAIQLRPMSPEAFLCRGSCWLAQGQYDKAIADCNEAVRLVPKLAEAFQVRGLAWQAKGDQANADADFETARRLKEMK